MKKLSVILSLLLSFNVFASDVLRMQFLDFKEAELENSIELLTTTVDFQKVILDCQSFITGMDFYKDGEIKTKVYIDAYECQKVFDLIIEAKQDSKPLCFELNPSRSHLTFSRKTKDCI